MKIILQLLMIWCLLPGCKLPGIAFTDDTADINYMKRLAVAARGFKGNLQHDTLNATVDPEDTAYTTMRMYQCVLKEASQLRNNLVEETILNQDHPDGYGIEPMEGHQFRLYMAVMGEKSGELAVFMPAMFDAADHCLKLGPAWIGTWNAGELLFYKTLRHRADRDGGPGRWIYDRRENEDRRTKSIILHGTNRQLRKQSVRFVTDRIEDIASLDSFRVVRIFRRSPSQIGADKGVMFSIPEIFQDSSMLRFIRTQPER